MASSVALAERMMRQRFGADLADHYTYAFVGDGCLMEGISYEAAALAGVLRRVKEARNITMVLVEHHMRTVMGLCNRIVVLDQGALIAEGSPTQIASNPQVIEAYLAEQR